MAAVKRLEHSLEKKAVLGNLEELREFVLRKAKQSGVRGNQEHCIFIALDELLSNVMKYAYPASSTGTVEVCCEERDKFHVEIRDRGVPFNPLTDAPEPDIKARVEDRGIGGLGLHMIRNMLDSLSYRYEDGQNIVGFDVRMR